MFNESDKEQIEQLKKFWREYGRLLLVAIAVGLACGYGWQYWQKYQHERNQRAAELFHQFNLMQSLQNDQQQKAKVLNELAASYETSAYAALAKMAEAVSLIQQQHYDEALQSLSWVRQHAKSKDLRDLASLREARLLLNLQRAQQSLDLLLEIHDSVYQPMAYELEGDAYAALGKSNDASKAYKKAQKAYSESGVTNLLIERKASSPVLIPNQK